MAEQELTVSWRTYVDAQDKAVTDVTNARLDGIDRAIKVALDANSVAILKAEQATEYRLAGMNEFRKAVEDQSNKQATKTELQALHSTFDAEIKALRDAHGAEIKGLQRLTNLGIGGLIVLEFFLRFFA
jgi:hypothetical protein